MEDPGDEEVAVELPDLWEGDAFLQDGFHIRH